MLVSITLHHKNVNVVVVVTILMPTVGSRNKCYHQKTEILMLHRDTWSRCKIDLVAVLTEPKCVFSSFSPGLLMLSGHTNAGEKHL